MFTCSLSSRPSRKTKEAATRYMEMITKDLRNPEEEYDDDDDVTNFPELPSAIKRGNLDYFKSALLFLKQFKSMLCFSFV